MIEKIEIENKQYALIVRNGQSTNGIQFLTKNDQSLQLAYIDYKKDFEIKGHFHEKWERKIQQTAEVLFIKKGKLRVDFYNEKSDYFFSKILNEKDTLITFCGGHGFKVLEEVQMLEVKQGPFFKDDRKFLNQIDESKIVVK